MFSGGSESLNTLQYVLCHEKAFKIFKVQNCLKIKLLWPVLTGIQLQLLEEMLRDFVTSDLVLLYCTGTAVVSA